MVILFLLVLVMMLGPDGIIDLVLLMVLLLLMVLMLILVLRMLMLLILFKVIVKNDGNTIANGVCVGVNR